MDPDKYESDLAKLKEKVSHQQGARALASPLYFIIQQIALVLCLDIIFPRFIALSWSGGYLEQALFVFLYAILYSLVCMLFLAVSAFLAILLEGLKVIKDIKTGKMGLQTAAQEIPYKVMTGSHPRWLIALAPPIVPMFSFSFLCLFFSANLNISDSSLLLKACVLLGLTSYLLSLPFILKAQGALHEVVSSESEQN